MNNWASNYVDRVNAKEEAEMAKNKTKWLKELNAISKQLKKKRFKREAKKIDNEIIPYIKRMAHYPGSYKSMVEGFEELLKFGKRQNRRIW